MKIRVYYEDTDVGGVVYYANYLKFCERARSELFFQRGLMPYNEKGHFFVKNLQAEYIGSAKLGDMLEVKNTLMKMGAAMFVLLQEVYRDDEVLFRLEITLVHVDYEGNIKRLSKEERELIQRLFSA